MVRPLSFPFSEIRKQVPQQELRVIFDVGANEGQSCAAYSEVLPDAEIHAFEPIPTTYAKLQQNTDRLKNIMTHNIALGAEDGTLQMVTGPTSTMNRVTKADTPNSTSVQALTINSFCHQRQIPYINFLKIDTEGHDLSILHGCGRYIRNVDFIQCEASANRYNKFHNSFIDIFNFLSDCDFYLFNISGQTYEYSNGGYPVLRRFDPIFINSRVVGPLRHVVAR